jgi:hypothetical protein
MLARRTISIGEQDYATLNHETDRTSAFVYNSTHSTELFKFNSTWTTQDATRFKRQAIEPRHSPNVLNEQVIVGTRSLTTPIERSSGRKTCNDSRIPLQAVIRYLPSGKHQQSQEETPEHESSVEGFEVQGEFFTVQLLCRFGVIIPIPYPRRSTQIRLDPRG